MTSCSFIPHIHEPATRAVGSSATLTDDIFIISVEFGAVSGSFIMSVS